MTTDSKFYRNMLMMMEGKTPLNESNNFAVSTLIQIVRILHAENEVAPVLAAKLKTLNENQNGGRNIKAIIGAAIGLALAIGTGALMELIHGADDVPFMDREQVIGGSEVTGYNLDLYRDGRIQESSASFFHRMQNIVEGVNTSPVIGLIMSLIKNIGGQQELIDQAGNADHLAESDDLSEGELTESNRKALIAAVVTFILAFGAIVANEVGAGIDHDWQYITDTAGNVVGKQDMTIHGPYDR